MRIMLDTQIYDLIIGTSGMVERLSQFWKEGKVVVLSTHIQEDQLASIPNKKKRTEIQRIVRQELPTSGSVIGVSRLGKARLGNGSMGGFGIDDFRTKSRKHTKDALIATTAARDADILVTEDRRFVNRMQALHSTCKVWRFNQLEEFLGI